MRYGNCLLYAISRFILSGLKGQIRVVRSSSRAGCTFYYYRDEIRYHYTSSPKGNMHPWLFKGKVIKRSVAHQTSLPE